MIRVWLKTLIAFLLVSNTGFLGAQTNERVGAPISLIGTGWNVEPRQGRLTMGIPLGGVNGPIPIPVVYRVNGSYQERYYPVTRQVMDPNTHQLMTVQSIDIISRPVYGALHFGYMTIGGTYGSITEPPAFALEDGTIFSESDFVPFTSFSSSFTWAQDFGLSAVSASNVKSTVVASHAWYTTTLSGLGSLQSAVAATYPSGFGANPTSFRVLMDKDLARVFAYIPAFGSWVPLV